MLSIRELCAQDYTTAALDGWSGRPLNRELRTKAITEDIVKVLEIDNKIMGFFHVKVAGSIEAIFVHPDIAGAGYGKKLIEMALSILSHYRCLEIRLKSRLNAIGFYERFGFTRNAPNGSMKVGSEQIEYAPMIKTNTYKDSTTAPEAGR